MRIKPIFMWDLQQRGRKRKYHSRWEHPVQVTLDEWITESCAMCNNNSKIFWFECCILYSKIVSSKCHHTKKLITCSKQPVCYRNIHKWTCSCHWIVINSKVLLRLYLILFLFHFFTQKILYINVCWCIITSSQSSHKNISHLNSNNNNNKTNKKIELPTPKSWMNCI